MKYLLLILSMSILLSAEMEVDGDLKVTGTVESTTIDSLNQEIANLKLIIAQLQAQIALISGNLGYTDCNGVIGGTAVVDNCGVCEGDNSTCGIFDIDGNHYLTVQIGEQEWMAENLRVVTYKNGEPIDLGIDITNWNLHSSGLYAFYDDNSDNVAIYGNLYNWYAVDDDRGICNEGWHVPSDDEWKELELFLGMSLEELDLYNVSRGTIEGGILKESGLEHWNSPNTSATNEYGFSALPSGYRLPTSMAYSGLGNKGYFWTSTNYSSSLVYYRRLHYDDSKIWRYANNKSHGFPVRCIKD